MNEHLNYEYQMLVYTHKRLTEQYFNGQSEFNVFHESFWIHARNLIDALDIVELSQYKNAVCQIATFNANARTDPTDATRLLSPNQEVYNTIVGRVALSVTPLS